MSSSSINKINGWYYDYQLNNPITSVSLHANKKYDKQNKIWYDWARGGSACDYERYKKQGDAKSGYGCGYGIEPLLSSILSEDFNISIANSWTDHGQDAISGLWNSIKPIAPYVPMLKGGYKELQNQARQLDTDTGSFIADSMSRFAQFITGTSGDPTIATINTIGNQIVSMMQDHLQDSLICQGTRFSYYSGSGTSFGNMVMRLTLFPKYEIIQGNIKFISVIDQIERLLPYFYGDIVEIDKNKLRVIQWLAALHSAASKSINNLKEGVRDKARGLWANILKASYREEEITSTETIQYGSEPSSYERVNDTGNEADNTRYENFRPTGGDYTIEFTETVRRSVIADAQGKFVASWDKSPLKTFFNNISHRFRDVTDGTKSFLKEIQTNLSGAFQETLDRIVQEEKLFSWQKAPGGFNPYYKDIDQVLEGTLKLRIGTQYSISSLVCQDATFNFSKQMVKNPLVYTQGNNVTEEFSPLYCDLSVTLRPACKYSNNMMMMFLRGIHNTEKYNLKSMYDSGYNTVTKTVNNEDGTTTITKDVYTQQKDYVQANNYWSASKDQAISNSTAESLEDVKKNIKELYKIK